MEQIVPFLKPGSLIGITCPSGYVAAERIAFCVEVLQRWQFRVTVGKTVGAGEYYFAGTDEERLNDLQNMLDDDEVAAILMGRGGYGTTRIIDRLDFTRFRQHPKWICGFSDITVLHSHIQATMGIPTLHSPMSGAFKPETEELYYIQSLRQALTGIPLNYAIAPTGWNRTGIAEGVLVGGNLAMLGNLTGSVSQVKTEGKLLFIEDIGEHLYNIDRLLLNLKRSGQIDQIKGLLVGSFTDLQDTDRPFGQKLEAIILDKVKELDIPVAFGFPCGHQDENVTLKLGANHKLEVTETGSHLAELLPV